MHKFIPIRIKTLVVAPAVDLRFNLCIKYIDKVVDTEGFQLIFKNNYILIVNVVIVLYQDNMYL